MPDIVIREGNADDLDAIERLENAVFETDRLSRRSLRHFLRSPNTDVPVACEAGTIVGYAMVAFRSGSTLARIFSLAVDASHARRGIGRALLGECEARAWARQASAVRLEVRVDNATAVRLYEGHGYRRFDTVQDYYEDGATALRFEKSLRAGAAARDRSSS